MKEREVDRIYREIYRRVEEYVYKPGEQLREKELMEEFGTSRTPIRDAMIRLAGEGLLTVVPNSGTFIHKVDFWEMMEVYEVRLHLVELSGLLAAARITKEELEEYETLLERINQQQDPKILIQLDSSFHEIINRATKNKELQGILRNLKIKSLSIWEYPVDPSYYQTILEDFAALYPLLKKRDGDGCRKVLADHVYRIMDHIKGKGKERW